MDISTLKLLHLDFLFSVRGFASIERYVIRRGRLTKVVKVGRNSNAGKTI